LSADALMELCGVPYYPHVPFVMERINKSFFDAYDTYSKIYIIGGISAGGSLKYTTDFIENVPKVKQILINSVLQKSMIFDSTILLIQHLNHDITPRVICDLYRETHCRVIINIHDFHYLCRIQEAHNSYLFSNISIHADIAEMFSIAESVIHPSHFTYNIYSRYFPTDKFVVSPPIDYANKYSELNIPTILNKTINIGVMHIMSE